jgi:predicted DNA-binding protein (UPF0251 family)
MLLQVLRQTQALKDSLSFSSNQVAALTAELEQLRSELEQCRQKAVTDQEQVSKQTAASIWHSLRFAATEAVTAGSTVVYTVLVIHDLQLQSV